MRAQFDPKVPRRWRLRSLRYRSVVRHAKHVSILRARKESDLKSRELEVAL